MADVYGRYMRRRGICLEDWQAAAIAVGRQQDPLLRGAGPGRWREYIIQCRIDDNNYPLPLP